MQNFAHKILYFQPRLNFYTPRTNKITIFAT